MLRVPYAGYNGDYQAIVALTPTPIGFPWLAKIGRRTVASNQPGRRDFTLVGDDVPFILLHLDHQVRALTMEVFDVATGESVGFADIEEFLRRNSTAAVVLRVRVGRHDDEAGRWQVATGPERCVPHRVVGAEGAWRSEQSGAHRALDVAEHHHCAPYAGHALAGALRPGAAPTAPGHIGVLDVYFVDVEGGHATLYVSPSGQSMLVDAGYAGFDGRDAGRIAAAASLAGVKQIDYLVVIHYHGDHIGGVPELAARLPIRNFVDHGQSSERGEKPDAAFNAYAEQRSKGAHLEVNAGDRIPVAGLTVDVLSSGGSLVSVPLEGGGIPNPLCGTFKPMKDETSDDAHSVGTLVTYGKFRMVDLGDLSWNQEYGLVCPTNRIGAVDVLLTSQHGDDEASSPTFVHALRPRVAIINNGMKKAVIQPAAETVRSSPGILDLWQLHYSMLGNPAERARGVHRQPGNHRYRPLAEALSPG